MMTPGMMQVVLEQQRREPEFIIHLGDLVHPVPDPKTFAGATAIFKDTFAPLLSKMHIVLGNHDVGDKPVHWIPQKR